jgi:hypothetical protein
MRTFVQAALFSAALMLPAAARAQEAAPPVETVSLKDGSVYRGELVEKIPGDHLTVKLATGEIKTFAWADLVVDNRQAPVAGGQVIEMTSDRPGTDLYRYEGAPTSYGIILESYQRICSAPCRTTVDPTARYFVAGDGVTPSDRFSLRPRPGLIHLRVAAGSASQRGWGWTTATLGSTALVVGLTLFIVGKVVEPDPNDSKYKGNGSGNFANDVDTADKWKRVSYWTIGGGALFLGLGITLIATSGTDVIDDSGPIAKIRLPGRITATPGGIQF